MISLSEDPPRTAFPSAPAPKAKLKGTASAKLAAASKSKAEPMKSGKPAEKKPKKK